MVRGEYGLSMNPNITPEFVEKFHSKPWNWGSLALSSNPMNIGIEKQIIIYLLRIIQKSTLKSKPICKDGSIGLS